jgi:protein SYS1
LFLISRSKLVPDFALTIHFIHLVVTWFYTKSIPTNLLWWLLQFGSAALMVALGVWACRYRELQPMINFGMAGKNAAQANGSAGADTHVRGAPGSGRREGAGPSYEMVVVKPGDDNV